MLYPLTYERRCRNSLRHLGSPPCRADLAHRPARPCQHASCRDLFRTGQTPRGADAAPRGRQLI